MIVNIIEWDIPCVKAVSSTGEDDGVHNIYIHKSMSIRKRTIRVPLITARVNGYFDIWIRILIEFFGHRIHNILSGR